MENNNGSPVLTLLAGAAVGAALGILFAPDNGEETRKLIVKTAKKYAEPIVDKVGDSISGWTETVYNAAPIQAFKKEEESSNFFLTMLLAVPVGAALGILFAPAKGSEIRQKIANTAIDGIENLSNVSSNIFGITEEDEVEAYVPPAKTGKSGRQHYS